MESFNNPYLYIPLAALVGSQFIKFIYLSVTDNKSFNHLLAKGSFPATLAAMITALAVASLTLGGTLSPAFGIVFTLAVVLVYMTYAHHVLAEKVHRLDETLSKSQDDDDEKRAVSIALARLQRPFYQVAGGVAVGLIAGYALTFQHWNDSMGWLFERQENVDKEAFTYLAIFFFLLVLSEGLIQIMKQRGIRRLPTSRRIKRTLRVTLTIPATIGILASLGLKYGVKYMDNRFWITLTFAATIVLTYLAYRLVYKRAHKHLQEESAHFKKTQTKAKRSKKKSQSKSGKKRKK